MSGVVATPSLIVGHSTEPVDLASMREWVSQDQPMDNTLLDGLITAAREWFERACDRAFVESAWEIRYACWPVLIELPYPPLRDVLSVKYLDQDEVLQTLATTVYNVVATTTPGTVQLADGQSWPSLATHPEAVRVQFRSGLDTGVPELAKVGIKMLVAYWYCNRGDQPARGNDNIPRGVLSIAHSLSSYRH